MTKGVSVIICCFNSEQVINETLQSLSVQQLDGIKAEVILVDNNCTDNTVAVARQLWHALKNPYPLRIIKENIPGLNHARKRGVSESNFAYFIFCDDDNRLDDNYIRVAYHEFENGTDVGVLGGWSEGQFENPPPYWFRAVEAAFAVGGKPELDKENVEYVWGAGMAFRTELAEKIFGEDLKTSDRQENVLTSGGDYEICDRVRATRYKICKLKALKYYHFIKNERLTWRYCTKLYEGFGYSHIEYRYSQKTARLKFGMLKSMLTFVVLNPRVFANSLMKKEGDIETLTFFSKWGSLKACFSVLRSSRNLKFF